MGKPRLELVSQRFGRLVAVSFAAISKDRATQWKCRCDCGTEKVIRGSSLVSGVTRSCGCLGRETQHVAVTKHGMTRTPEHKAYCSAKERCTNTNHSKWKNY